MRECCKHGDLPKLDYGICIVIYGVDFKSWQCLGCYITNWSHRVVTCEVDCVKNLGDKSTMILGSKRDTPFMHMVMAFNEIPKDKVCAKLDITSCQTQRFQMYFYKGRIRYGGIILA